MWDFLLEVLKEMGIIFMYFYDEVYFMGVAIIVVIIYYIGFGVNYGVNYFDELKTKTFIVGASIMIGSLGILGLNIFAKKTEGFVDDLDTMNYYMYTSLVFLVFQMALPEINIPIKEIFREIRENISVSRVSDRGIVVERSVEAIAETTGWGLRVLMTMIILFVSLCMAHLVFRYVPFFMKHKYTFYSLSAVVGLLIILIGFKIDYGVSTGTLRIERK